jgi:hypothetical protein
MKNQIESPKFSKMLHFAVILCFALPFFFHEGCQNTSISGDTTQANDSIALDSSANINDTTTLAETPADSIVNVPTDSINISTDNQSADTVAAGQDMIKQKDDFRESGAWKLFFEPKKDHYSGLGEVYMNLYFFRYTSISLAFILIILCLVIKFMESEARKSIILLDALSLIALLIYSPAAEKFDRLWGFWVVLILLTSLIAVDIYQMRKKNSEQVPA